MVSILDEVKKEYNTAALGVDSGLQSNLSALKWKKSDGIQFVR